LLLSIYRYFRFKNSDSEELKMMEKTYLGDGVYVEFDGDGFMLTTENGIEITNKIYLELFVYSALTKFVKQIWRMSKD
jgi:hypothetical protein